MVMHVGLARRLSREIAGLLGPVGAAPGGSTNIPDGTHLPGRELDDVVLFLNRVDALVHPVECGDQPQMVSFL